METILDCPGGPKVITRVLTRRRQEDQRHGSGKCDDGSWSRSELTRNREPRNAGSFWKLKKERKWIFS